MYDGDELFMLELCKFGKIEPLLELFFLSSLQPVSMTLKKIAPLNALNEIFFVIFMYNFLSRNMKLMSMWKILSVNVTYNENVIST